MEAEVYVSLTELVVQVFVYIWHGLVPNAYVLLLIPHFAFKYKCPYNIKEAPAVVNYEGFGAGQVSVANEKGRFFFHESAEKTQKSTTPPTHRAGLLWSTAVLYAAIPG